MVELFVLGRVATSHGLKGAMRVASYLESDGTLKRLAEVILRKRGEEGKAFKVRGVKPKGRAFILMVEGIEDARAAGRWSDADVFASSSILDELPPGEYYWKDLIGLRVVTEEGQYLGRVEDIMPTGSNDVYVCRGGEREILLPAVEDVVRKVDIGEGTMVVKLYKGL